MAWWPGLVPMMQLCVFINLFDPKGLMTWSCLSDAILWLCLHQLVWPKRLEDLVLAQWCNSVTVSSPTQKAWWPGLVPVPRSGNSVSSSACYASKLVSSTYSTSAHARHCFKGKAGKTSERQGGVHNMWAFLSTQIPSWTELNWSFSECTDTILNWSELNWSFYKRTYTILNWSFSERTDTILNWSELNWSFYKRTYTILNWSFSERTDTILNWSELNWSFSECTDTILNWSISERTDTILNWTELQWQLICGLPHAVHSHHLMLLILTLSVWTHNCHSIACLV